MAKGFKQSLSRVIPSFQSCRSKDLPENPVPSSAFCLSPINPKSIELRFPAACSAYYVIHQEAAPPPSPSCPPKRLQLLSSAAVSVGCGCRSKPDRRRVHDRPNKELEEEEGKACRWEREEKWHVVAPRQKIDFNDLDDCTDASTDYIFESDATTTTNMRKKDQMNNKKKKKKKSKKYQKKKMLSSSFMRPGRFSCSSSADSGWFSSEEQGYNAYDEDDNDETETCLISSQIFSAASASASASDSAEFTPALAPIIEKSYSQAPRKSIRGTRMKKMGGNRRRRKSKSTAAEEEEVEGEARVSVLRRLMPWRVEGKVMRESMAVVKRSEDPYEDFRRSMAEMIMEKGMYDDPGELEQLLRCFLSLNSRTHHSVILEAFSDIWDALFISSHAPLPDHHLSH